MIPARGHGERRHHVIAAVSVVALLLTGVIGSAPSVFARGAGSTDPGPVGSVVVNNLFTPTAPKRILDPRPDGGSQVGPYTTPWGAGVTRDVAVVGGVSPVPADAVAVVVNVTVTETTGSSFLTVWPAGQTRPTVSSLNWTQGRTIANLVTVKLGAAGKISIYNLTGLVDPILDVAGYYTATSPDGFTSLPPARVLDSRPASNVGDYATPWTTGTTRNVVIGGRGGVPAGADAVVLNVTATKTTGASYLTVWPAGQAMPTASNLNWRAGRTIPNLVTVKLGAGARSRSSTSLSTWT